MSPIGYALVVVDLLIYALGMYVCITYPYYERGHRILLMFELHVFCSFLYFVFAYQMIYNNQLASPGMALMLIVVCAVISFAQTDPPGGGNGDKYGHF